MSEEQKILENLQNVQAELKDMTDKFMQQVELVQDLRGEIHEQRVMKIHQREAEGLRNQLHSVLSVKEASVDGETFDSLIEALEKAKSTVKEGETRTITVSF